MAIGGLVVVFIIAGIPAIIGFSALLKLYIEHVNEENKREEVEGEDGTVYSIVYVCRSCGNKQSFHYTKIYDIKERLFRICKCSTSRHDRKLYIKKS